MKEGPSGPDDGIHRSGSGVFVCFAVITVKIIDLSKKMRYSIEAVYSSGGGDLLCGYYMHLVQQCLQG